MDTLRALGWEVPARGPASRALAWVAYPFFAVKDLSLNKARLAFDYLRTDQTRLMPAAAIEEAFGSLLAMAQGTAMGGDGELARLLRQDVQAMAFLYFPQFPSSRAFGAAPAVDAAAGPCADRADVGPVFRLLTSTAFATVGGEDDDGRTRDSG